MTIRLEPDLRSSFAEAADLEHRAAAQVLRDFMREYVERSRSRAPARPLISAAGRKRREDAVNYGRSSVSLDRLQPQQSRREARTALYQWRNRPARVREVREGAQ